MTKKVILANMLNDIMISYPDLQYAVNMGVVTPRKIWLASCDDIIITPFPIDTYFKKYACNILGIDPDSVHTLSPNGAQDSYLADRLADNDHQQLSTVINDDYELLCFAPDKATMKFAKRYQLPLSFYNDQPTNDVIDLIYQMNTKSGFRAEAATLGLSIVKGRSCHGLTALEKVVRELFQQVDKIIVKSDRSSNGFCHLVLDKHSCETSLYSILSDHCDECSFMEQTFTVEEYINSVAQPSVEIVVTNDGPQILYICDQRCINNTYSGMVTPPKNLDTATMDELRQIGNLFGEYVYKKGFRGVCDVDSCLDGRGNLYVTETNFRRTAGTFIDYLVKRLKGADFYQHYVWLQDSVICEEKRNFQQVLDMLAKKDLLLNEKHDTGIILYCDTFSHDNKLRYLIIASTIEQAEQIELLAHKEVVN